MRIETEFDIGEKVHDDLTRSEAIVIGIQMEFGKVDGRLAAMCPGYWLDNDWLGGGRHPWEIDHLPPKESQYASLYNEDDLVEVIVLPCDMEPK